MASFGVSDRVIFQRGGVQFANGNVGRNSPSHTRSRGKLKNKYRGMQEPCIVQLTRPMGDMQCLVNAGTEMHVDAFCKSLGVDVIGTHVVRIANKPPQMYIKFASKTLADRAMRIHRHKRSRSRGQFAAYNLILAKKGKERQSFSFSGM